MHPANSEAVCPVTFREDLLVGLTTLGFSWIAGRFPPAAMGKRRAGWR